MGVYLHRASALPFQDRHDAARRLALEMGRFAGTGTIVFGIPRGGVPLAADVAAALNCPLDVIVARKLGSPISPELAIGAVTADGGCFLNQDVIAELAVTSSYLEAECDRQLTEARHREQEFRGGSPPAAIAGKVAIICDDGLATGATMHAAVRAMRARGAGRVVVAVPVGSRQACESLAREADEVICPERPEPFGAVGRYYRHFEPVEDEEVLRLLRGAGGPP